MLAEKEYRNEKKAKLEDSIQELNNFIKLANICLVKFLRDLKVFHQKKKFFRQEN